MPSSVDSLVKPAFQCSPEWSTTLGPEVADLSAMAGFAPDPEQRLALDLLFARDAAGKVSAFQFGLVCARQNLKTGTLKQAALGWLYLTGEELVMWSAHEFATAQEAFRDMCVLIQSCPELDREVEKISYANGDEAIELTENRRLRFKARTKGGGRGLSGNKVVLDEAMYLTPAHMGALVPTMSARVGGQLVLAGSAGFAHSEVMQEMRDRAHAGTQPDLAYLEWAAPQGGCQVKGCSHHKAAVGCALDDRENWRKANPALGRRIAESFIASERRALPVREFMRERMGWWESPTVGGLFHMPAWHNLARRESQPGPVLVFGVHVSTDRARAAVAVAGVRPDGKLHVELVEHREDVAWVVPRVKELAERHQSRGVVLAATMAAGSLAPELKRLRGFEALPTGDVRKACGAFYDAVNSATLVHNPHPDLDTAVRLASKSSDKGEWIFDAPVDVDLSPLYATALAAWSARLVRSPSIW